MERIETTILRNLVFNEDYSRKVIPFIQPDYFEQKTEKVIFEEIVQFIVKYGSAITIEALNIEVENRTDLTEDQIKEIRDINKSLNDSPVEKQWLLDTTEKWCRDLKTMRNVMTFIIVKKIRSSLIWNISTKSQRVVSLIRLSTSLWLARVLGNRYSCAMWLVPSYCKAGPFSISLLKWQRNELRKGLMQTFSILRFSRWLISHVKCSRIK